MEGCSYTIRQAQSDICNLEFGEDPCDLGTYLRRRLAVNELQHINNMSRPGISPELYGLLQNAQPTTSSVERAFSIVGNLYTDDRPFDPNSVGAYMRLLYDSSTWKV